MSSSVKISHLRDALLLFLWGGLVLWTAHAGELSTYLHPVLQPYAVATGILLPILGLFAMREVLRPVRGCHECCHGGHQDHAHPADSPLPLLFKTVVLLFPLAVVLSGQADRFTITTVQNRGVVDDLAKLPSAQPSKVTASPAPVAAPSPVSDKAPSAMPLQVIDMLYAIQMPSYREEFEGKECELVGQYVPMTTGNPKGDRFQVIRMFITCCAADAKPVGVTVRYPKKFASKEMGWFRIIGKPTFPMEGGRRTAVFEASSIEPCPAPSEPFVY